MAVTDVLTAAEASATLNASIDASDDLLVAVNTGVSEFLDQRCGPIVQRAIVSETHDGWTSRIRLAETPVSAVSQVRVNGVALDPSAYVLRRRRRDRAMFSGVIDAANFGTFPGGVDSIEIDYTAGRFTSTGEVPERFKAAARITLRNMWRQYEHASRELDEFNMPHQAFPTFALPKAAAALLVGELRSNFGIA